MTSSLLGNVNLPSSIVVVILPASRSGVNDPPLPVVLRLARVVLCSSSVAPRVGVSVSLGREIVDVGRVRI